MYVPMLMFGYWGRANWLTSESGSPRSLGLKASVWGFQARFSRREKPARRLNVVIEHAVQSMVSVRSRRPRKMALVSQVVFGPAIATARHAGFAIAAEEALG
jgi:hypothetical protein